jgi:succinyl-CoA synthetase beta subunit
MARTLSEYESKRLLREYGVTTVAEFLVENADEAIARAEEMGFPVALKLCGATIAHKTERDLIRLNLSGAAAVRTAAAELLAKQRAEDGEVGLLLQAMARGRREIIVGMVRDPQFGPCVMLGLGGILAEAMRDVVFRMAPPSRADVDDMMAELKAGHLLGPFRGEPGIDRDALAQVVTAVARVGLERAEVRSIDVNPLILTQVAGKPAAQPIAVDALIEVEDPS